MHKRFRQRSRAIFVSRDDPPHTLFVADSLYSLYESHRLSLSATFSGSIAAEMAVVASHTFEELCHRQADLYVQLTAEASRAPLRQHNLFCVKYANTYIGISQAVQIDAIAKAIAVAAEQRIITDDHRRWLIVALGRALLKVSNSTGHFAQFLKPKPSSFKRYLRQRRRDVWSEWLNSTGELNAAGDIDWRKGNKCFNEDSLTLIPKLGRSSCLIPKGVFERLEFVRAKYEIPLGLLVIASLLVGGP